MNIYEKRVLDRVPTDRLLSVFKSLSVQAYAVREPIAHKNTLEKRDYIARRIKSEL